MSRAWPRRPEAGVRLATLSFVAIDTTRHARRVQERTWRSLGPRGRVRLAASMSDDARQITTAGIVRRHPEFTDERVVRELILRMHGVDVSTGARNPRG